MQPSLLEQGATLMLVGMGTVFVFLTALVLGMSLMSALITRLQPATASGVSDEEVAAISAAIALHRKKKF
ncbi:MAG TPA: OadG family transporter subunit [Woeseiaceae bacterium]